MLQRMLSRKKNLVSHRADLENLARPDLRTWLVNMVVAVAEALCRSLSNQAKKMPRQRNRSTGVFGYILREHGEKLVAGCTLLVIILVKMRSKESSSSIDINFITKKKFWKRFKNIEEFLHTVTLWKKFSEFAIELTTFAADPFTFKTPFFVPIGIGFAYILRSSYPHILLRSCSSHSAEQHYDTRSQLQ